MSARVKKNDTVVMLSGKDKGKKGLVIKVLPQKGKVMVKDVALITKHAKARKSGETSGIKKKESYVDLSKVMPVCTVCKKPCRVNFKKLETAKRTRICNRCKEIF